MASRISGNRMAGHDHGRLSQRAEIERRASMPTWSGSVDRLTRPAPPLLLRLLLGGLHLGCALERATGLGKEDVVEGRRVQLEVLDRDTLGVQRPHHLGELGVPPDSRTAAAFGRARRPPRRSAPAPPSCRSSSLRGAGHDLDARPPDLVLERLRRALGDDPTVVDDPHAVGEHVGLLEVLGGEEDRHAAVGGQALHLLPERAAALRVETRGGLVEEQDPGPVHERESQVEPALHASRVAAAPGGPPPRRGRPARAAPRCARAHRRRACPWSAV